jgi:hypothetical protein
MRKQALDRNNSDKTSNTGVLCLLAVSAGLAASPVGAEQLDCALVGGVLPEGCLHANAGQVVARPASLSAEHKSAGDLGSDGFAISVESGITDDRKHISGEPAATARLKKLDQARTGLGLQVAVDGLGAKPVLAVTTGGQRTYQAGETVRFASITNYPTWIQRAEIAIFDPEGSGAPLAVIPASVNGVTPWVMPSDGPESLVYVLHVYDAGGRRDETLAQSIVRTERNGDETGTTPDIDLLLQAEDQTARRGIPVHGALVTLSGIDLPADATVALLGERLRPGVRRQVTVQRILPPGTHEVVITAGRQNSKQKIIIPHRDIFATAIIDATIGRDSSTGETWTSGRVAGFVDGYLSSGVRLRASVDTREAEFRDLFRNFGRRYPDQVLRQIDDRDVWVVTGDDSKTENLAPTSGRLFLRLEDGPSHAMWGDFRPADDLERVVRTDRTLYGALSRWESSEAMPNGEARATATAYAGQIDRLTQRDVFRGTGGSTYFLSRRDIETGTETLIVEARDPVSGRILSSRRLVEGRDYRIDYTQGVVILNAPLVPSSQGPGLVNDRPLGDYDINLVAQYDYVPSSGADLADAYGGRAEIWLTPNLRIGASGSRETTGLADNTLTGADILLQRHEGTYLSVDIAQSEGPGPGSRLSLTGGMDLAPDLPSAGVIGQKADAVRAEGRLDLADIGSQGHVLAWYENREAGFWSPDYNSVEGQISRGVSGEVALGNVVLTFGGEVAQSGADKETTKTRLGIRSQVREDLTLEVEAAVQDRRNLRLDASPGENGSRTDVAARLTWDLMDDARVWVFGQTSTQTTGDVLSDDRIGVGAEMDVSDKLSVSAELSNGRQGVAGRAGVSYRPNDMATYRINMHDDGTQYGQSGRQGLSFGLDRKINDRWAMTSETLVAGDGSDKSIASNYGVTFSPSSNRQYSLGIINGTFNESDGRKIARRGLSFGTTFSNGDEYDYRLRAEYREDRLTGSPLGENRDTLLLSGDYSYQASEDWRLVASADIVNSRGGDDAIPDGRYVEGRIGFAYRPVEHDRLNALFGLILLDDQPGPDQVNIDGDVNGPRQRSFILNAALSYDLNERWTLGLKYGFRHREQTDRLTQETVESSAHLGIVRLEYRVAQMWDILGEGRLFHSDTAETYESGALLGIYREVNPNTRIGLGYSWGGVQDDLRKIEPAKEGLFLNVIAKF